MIVEDIFDDHIPNNYSELSGCGSNCSVFPFLKFSLLKKSTSHPSFNWPMVLAAFLKAIFKRTLSWVCDWIVF